MVVKGSCEEVEVSYEQVEMDKVGGGTRCCSPMIRL